MFIDVGDIIYIIEKNDKILEANNISIDNTDINYRKIILPDNYFFVIIKLFDGRLELLIFKIDNDNEDNKGNLHRIFGVTHKKTPSLGTILTANIFTDYSKYHILTYNDGLPTVDIETDFILKIIDSNEKGYSYNTLINKARINGSNFYGMFTKEGYLDSKNILGYYAPNIGIKPIVPEPIVTELIVTEPIVTEPIVTELIVTEPTAKKRWWWEKKPKNIQTTIT